MLSSMRRHSLRLQHELHRWSLCDPGSQPAPDRLGPRRVSRSKSCVSSTGESHGSQGSWSSSDSVISTDSAGAPFRVVLLGGSHVGKTAFASIFAGAADSMDSEDCEMYGGESREVDLLEAMLCYSWQYGSTVLLFVGYRTGVEHSCVFQMKRVKELS